MAKGWVFSSELKLRVILESLSGAKTNAQICREHQIVSTVVLAWKERFSKAASAIFSSPASQSKEQERIVELVTVWNLGDVRSAPIGSSSTASDFPLVVVAGNM
jgi:transposase-like protein